MKESAAIRPSAEELVGRLLESTVGAMDVLSVYLGEKLGYYEALAKAGPATPGELARRTESNQRYAREWLEQQVTTGILEVDDAGVPADTRRYSLPPEYAAVLVDRTSELFVAPVGRFVAASMARADGLLHAYRHGGGVGWEEFGADMRTAQSDFNRPFFMNSLVPEYISHVPGVDAALSRPGARVAEVGPGGGWAAIAIARAYPGATVDGFELDAASVEMARDHIAREGVAGRVEIHHRDAGASGLEGKYDLVAAFECIHDLSDPVSVLATMRRLVKDDGTVLVMDERVGEAFGSVGDFAERLFYGFSLSVCLPDGMSRQPSAATGTVMRPAVLRDYARKAGFREVEILPLEHDLFRFYRLHR